MRWLKLALVISLSAQIAMGDSNLYSEPIEQTFYGSRIQNGFQQSYEWVALKNQEFFSQTVGEDRVWGFISALYKKYPRYPQSEVLKFNLSLIAALLLARNGYYYAADNTLSHTLESFFKLEQVDKKLEKVNTHQDNILANFLFDAFSFAKSAVRIHTGIERERVTGYYQHIVNELSDQTKLLETVRQQNDQERFNATMMMTLVYAVGAFFFGKEILEIDMSFSWLNAVKSIPLALLVVFGANRTGKALAKRSDAPANRMLKAIEKCIEQISVQRGPR